MNTPPTPPPTTPRPSSDLSASDQRWLDLAAELTPAKSLARLDTATARVVATVSVIATLLTGFGLIASRTPTSHGLARWLTLGSVVLAVAALIAAMTAQTLTITRGLNTNDLTEVEAWYQQRFQARAPLTRWAGILLVLAATTAGTAAVIGLAAGSRETTTLAVTRTAELPDTTPATSTQLSTMTVQARFTGLTQGQAAAVTVTSAGVVVAEAAFTAGDDGVAARTLTVQHLPSGAGVDVIAHAGDTTCTATVPPGRPAQIHC